MERDFMMVKKRPTVGAEASDGYEIDYFYGDRQMNPKSTIIQAIGSSVSYKVLWMAKDHKFQVQVQGKETYFDPDCQSDLPEELLPRGTYKSKTNIPITAVAKSGYTFSGWTVIQRRCKIMNASSASTTVQLQSSNSTLQANFSKAGKTFYFSIRTGKGKLDVFDERGWNHIAAICFRNSIESFTGWWKLGSEVVTWYLQSRNRLEIWRGWMVCEWQRDTLRTIWSIFIYAQWLQPLSWWKQIRIRFQSGQSYKGDYTDWHVGNGFSPCIRTVISELAFLLPVWVPVQQTREFSYGTV